MEALKVAKPSDGGTPSASGGTLRDLLADARALAGELAQRRDLLSRPEVLDVCAELLRECVVGRGEGAGTDALVKATQAREVLALLYAEMHFKVLLSQE